MAQERILSCGNIVSRQLAASRGMYRPVLIYIPLGNRPERMKLGSALDAGTSLLGPIGMAFLPQAIIT